MSLLSLKETITEAMKAAMRAHEKERLTTIRLILSEAKQIEVDERIVIDDTRMLVILDKMLKQRRDSVSQFQQAGRQDLIDIELAEISIIQSFMPQQLTETEIAQLISDAMTETGATTVKDMGKVMAILKPKMQGRADMAVVGSLIKQQLAG
jgi:uncharacterized protein YqeY